MRADKGFRTASKADAVTGSSASQPKKNGLRNSSRKSSLRVIAQLAKSSLGSPSRMRAISRPFTILPALDYLSAVAARQFGQQLLIDVGGVVVDFCLSGCFSTPPYGGGLGLKRQVR